MTSMMPDPSGGMRIRPLLTASQMKTYGLRAPIPTHYRPASCADAECPNHTNGWRTIINESTDLGQQQGAYIRSQSGRKFVETRNEVGLTVFTFEAGQKCFEPHVMSLETGNRSTSSTAATGEGRPRR